jgi:hypothetical protein
MGLVDKTGLFVIMMKTRNTKECSGEITWRRKDMDYIKVPKTYDKLKRAEKDFRPVYISQISLNGNFQTVQ